jgi:hypothetical protein
MEKGPNRFEKALKGLNEIVSMRGSVQDTTKNNSFRTMRSLVENITNADLTNADLRDADLPNTDRSLTILENSLFNCASIQTTDFAINTSPRVLDSCR